MYSFVDTNVSVAYVFRIDPFNNKSENVFKRYTSIFWSNLVKKELDDVFVYKKKVLVRFYKGLLKDLKDGKISNLTLANLKRHVENGNYIKKDFKHIKNSLDPFWDKYVDDRFPSKSSFESAINLCLKDLRILTYSRKVFWENKVTLSEKRIEKYSHLNNMLLRNGVHHPDNEIILDAHDHNLRNSYDLDFITFDCDCYNGAKLSGFSFHDVKSIRDFTF